METLEVCRRVTCPETGEETDVDNECCFCKFYDGVEGGSIENPGVICTYDDQGEEEE